MNSIQKTARTAGFLYLLLVPLGIFGILYVPNTLIVADDIAATMSNILANEQLFRLSIVSAVLVQLVNIFVALYLYKVLKPASEFQARLMVIFSLLAVPIALLNELTHYAVLLILHGVADFGVASAETLVAFMLEMHRGGIFVAQIFWGLWLFPMGYLVFKSRFMPRIIGFFLMIGCLGYVIDSANFFLLPDLDVTVSEFTFLGELMITFWLLIKGVNVERWQQQAQEAA